MALNLNLKNLPPYLQVVIKVVLPLAVIVLFVVLIYIPKNEEIKTLQAGIAKLDNEIASSEVKARKLEELKAENARLKTKLAELQEQLPEEKEVSTLLRQISDLGLNAGLEILLWRPEAKKPDPGGLYVEIPVTVSAIGGYHDVGVFFSHISQLKRIVNLSNIALTSHVGKNNVKMVKADFIASTFSAVTEEKKEEKK